MPKPAKILIGGLAGYVRLIVAFESMMDIVQPRQRDVLTIKTTDADGVASDRVVSRLDDNGRTFVSANHWPRAWYREALANPDVQITIDGVREDDRAVSIEDAAEHERLDTVFTHLFAFRLITGFPPRYFLRLDPKS